MHILFLQAGPGLYPGLDWQQLAAVYGPLVGVLAVVLKIHWDMLHKTIPQALRAIRGEQRKNRHMMAKLLVSLRDVNMRREKRPGNAQAARKRTAKGKGRQNSSP